MACLIATGCGGKLTDEQREKIKEDMKAGEIKKVSDADFTAAAFALGRNISSAILSEDPYMTNKQFADSVASANSVKIFAMHYGDSSLTTIESEIIEAYNSVVDGSNLADNVQEIGTDSVLYTRPITVERPDGSKKFSFALALKIPNKQVVLSIK